MKTLFSHPSALLALFSLGFITLHVITANSGYVNYEYTFEVAANCLLDFECYGGKGWGHYWQVQANPLGGPLISALFSRILGVPLDEFFTRLPMILMGSLIGVLTNSYALRLFQFEENRKNKWLVTALVSLTPLVWVYSGRATADVGPVFFLTLSLSLVLSPQAYRIFLSGVFFGIGVICKYHVAFFGIPYLIFLYDPKRSYHSSLKKIMLFLIPAGLLVSTYLALIYSNFDIIGVPERFKSIHGLDPKLIGSGLYAYGMYIPLLLGPISLLCLFDVFERKSRMLWINALLAIAYTVALPFLPSGVQELEMGVWGHIFPSAFIEVIKVFCFWIFLNLLTSLFIYCKGRRQTVIKCISFFGPFFLILLASRPAQRYLIFVIPALIVFLIYQAGATKKLTRLTLIGLSLAYFTGTNTIMTAWQVAHGNAAKEMFSWIESQDLVSETCPSWLRPFLTHRFIEGFEDGNVCQQNRIYFVNLDSKNHIEDKRNLVKEIPVKLFGSYQVTTLSLRRRESKK